MLRIAIAALTLVAAVTAPQLVSRPAQACGIIYVPTDTKAELAAIRKALPRAKLAAEAKEKVAKLLAAAAKPHVAEADREKAIGEAMKILELPRILQEQACMTIRLPELVS